MPQTFKYFIVTGIVFISLFLGLIIWQYRVLCTYTERLRVVIDQYDTYIDTVKQMLKKTKEDQECTESLSPEQEPVPDEDEVTIDELMVINRTPQYLKDSTFSYLKTQQLDSLISQIDAHEWHDYHDAIIQGNQPKNSHTKKQRIKKSSSSLSSKAWRVPRKRPSLTGITFALPIEQSKFWLSSFFGPRKKPSGEWGFHYGVDMAAQRGTPVKAAAAGIVERAGYVSGYGNMVMIVHDAAYKTRYAHLDTIQVKVGQKIIRGQKIGSVGDTGSTRKRGKDASHLHFELYERGTQVNPLSLLTFSTQQKA